MYLILKYFDKYTWILIFREQFIYIKYYDLSNKE